MSEKTSIEWTDATWSPWWGCTEVSPACDHCYARMFSRRVGYAATSTKFPIWGKNEPRRFFDQKHWDKPKRWNDKAAKEAKRIKVFPSMCDPLEDRRDLDEWRDRLWNLIYDTPYLDWLLLTKRPQNFRRMLPPSMIANPLPNVWGMTTVESPDFCWRMDALRATPFHIRGVSFEPLLQDVGKLNLDGIDWGIIGFESGGGARPGTPEWARNIRDQFQAAGKTLLFKQWGEWAPFTVKGTEQRKLVPVGDGTHHAMFRVGKKAAGALLDGREWREFPR